MVFNNSRLSSATVWLINELVVLVKAVINILRISIRKHNTLNGCEMVAAQ